MVSQLNCSTDLNEIWHVVILILEKKQATFYRDSRHTCGRRRGQKLVIYKNFNVLVISYQCAVFVIEAILFKTIIIKAMHLLGTNHLGSC